LDDTIEELQPHGGAKIVRRQERNCGGVSESTHEYRQPLSDRREATRRNSHGVTPAGDRERVRQYGSISALDLLRHAMLALEA
jgi:hypothetical protein